VMFWISFADPLRGFDQPFGGRIAFRAGNQVLTQVAGIREPPPDEHLRPPIAWPHEADFAWSAALDLRASRYTQPALEIRSLSSAADRLP
jgi:hypothetical protein